MGKFWGKLVSKLQGKEHTENNPKLIPSCPLLFHKAKLLFFRIGKHFSTSPLEGLLLLLILLLFPSNLAKHFVLPGSYILGVFIDYLSPTIYLTEILIFLLLLIGFLRRRSKARLPVGKEWRGPKTLFWLVFLFLASLFPSVLVAPEKTVAVFRFLELSLWFGFSLWVAATIRWKEHRKLFRFLGWGVVWVSLLALGQFLLQRSVFGYWFLGEPFLAPSLGGVAQGSLLGQEVLRAYGTFPHPNVLGGVLSVGLIWLFSARFWRSFAVGVGGVLVSLSRTALVSLVGGILGLTLFRGGLGLVLLEDLSVSRRWELLQSAWEMFASAPLTGVGLGQFVSNLPHFGLPSGLSLFLQPVHNVFALVAAESGIFALLFFLALFLLALRETLRKRRFLLTISLLQLLFLGFFDHYLYTLPQGLFLLSLTLGLSFSSSEE